MFDSYSGCKKHNAIWNHDGGCPGCEEERNLKTPRTSAEWDLEKLNQQAAEIRRIKGINTTEMLDWKKELESLEMVVKDGNLENCIVYHQSIVGFIEELITTAYNQGKQDNQCTHNEFV